MKQFIKVGLLGHRAVWRRAKRKKKSRDRGRTSRTTSYSYNWLHFPPFLVVPEALLHLTINGFLKSMNFSMHKVSENFRTRGNVGLHLVQAPQFIEEKTEAQRVETSCSKSTTSSRAITLFHPFAGWTKMYSWLRPHVFHWPKPSWSPNAFLHTWLTSATQVLNIDWQ